MSPTSYQAALPRVIPSLLSATLIIIPYSNGFVKRVQQVFLQRKQRMKTRLLAFFPESQQPRCIDSIYSNSQKSGQQLSAVNQANQSSGETRASARATIRGKSAAMLQPNFRKVAFVFDRSISIAFKSGLYGGRYVPRGCNWGAPYFNSRPSARGDWKRARQTLFVFLFQFTPLREGRHAHASPNIRALSAFQFTPLREGRRRSRKTACIGNYFNSRPSARGDGCAPCTKGGGAISIHAPPRGATHNLPFSPSSR